MPQVEAPRYTVGVFKDVAFAEQGLAALARHGFPPEAISVIARTAPEVVALVEKVFGRPGEGRDLPGIGASVSAGSLAGDLDGGADGLSEAGLALALRRAGFQPHDGRIFETLTGRGGILVAVRTEPRAADALSVLHSYGGGNAAIGAWTGRL